MDPAGRQLAEQADNIIRIQLIIGALVATGCFLLGGVELAQAAVYGALVSMILGWMLSRGLAKAGAAAAESPERGKHLLYIGAVQRFLLVIGLSAVGLIVLKLNGVAMIAGFIGTQMAYIFGRHSARH